MSHGLLVLEGSVLVAGFSFDSVEGAGLAQKLMNLKAKSPEELSELAGKSGNFAATMKPGSLLLVPSGVILVTWARVRTFAVKWNAFLGENNGMKVRNFRMLAAMLVTYPTLSAVPGYMSLKQYLDDTDV